jgi:hypothetical protein
MQVSANISLVRWLRNPYRRWLRTALLLFGWCGLVPIVLIAGYYAVTPNKDFDPALAKLRSGLEPQNQLGWVIRIGGSSAYWKDIAFVSNRAGYNVDDAEAQRRRLQVSEAAGLTETRSATYVAKFHGSPFPVVITAFRDVNSEGRISYDTVLNGRQPVVSYFLLLVGASIFAILFLELVQVAQHGRQ